MLSIGYSSAQKRSLMYLSAASQRMVTMTASRPLACLFLGDLQRCGGRGCGGDADEQAVIAAQILRHGVGALGRHLDVLVGELGVVDLRDDGRGHVLQAFEAVEGRVGLHGDALDLRVQLLQAAGGAHEGAGGAEAGDEVRDLAFGLLPDLVGGGAVVGAPVFVVGVLVGVEVAVGLGGDQLARFADGAVGAVGGVGPEISAP